MKKITALVAVALIGVMSFSAFAMNAVRNVTRRPVFLRLNSGKTVRLQPGKSVAVSEQDLKNPVIAELIKIGDVVLEKDKGGK
ncbi:MAG TPA: hypothetical protein PLM53_16995 [Spirochaetota bacterium]|nr:hypothetical protein [Spirochaetota bacterium]HPC43163.1 hypothetical protein [Spirochaetota bacterium]HPL16360.1 hypothetical protein [Spirochaetota bacterium]HQF10057.1 hypothetical protein [Spirochaetota bacterium]HQH98796.1 hypothetical protein [Spirochaetota bacterium]